MNHHTSQQIGGTLAALIEDDTPLPAVIRTLLCELGAPNGGKVLSLLLEALAEPDCESPHRARPRTVRHGPLERACCRLQNHGWKVSMSNRRTRQEMLLDLIVPVGAVLVICFALGSLFYDGHFRYASNRSHEVIKAYKHAMAPLP